MGLYKRGDTWWVSYAGPRGLVRESTGETDKVLAKRFETQRRRAVKDESWRPLERTGKLTVATYAERWIARQHERNLSTSKDMETRMRLHVLPLVGSRAIEDLRPRDIVAFLEQVQTKGLAPRTVHHVYDALRLMLKAAQFDEIIIGSPCVLPSGTLPKKRDAVPGWRHEAVFSAHEIEQLISDERNPLDRRVYYALIMLAGLRHGEAAGRKWSDYDDRVRPLGRLKVVTQYDGEDLKTENPRVVPVHPTLAAALAVWRAHGFGELFGRSPKPSDWLVPSRRGNHRTVRLTLTRLHEDLARIGLRPRRTHDLRRTFVSLARAAGANSDALKVVSHGPGSEVMDMYTTYPWATLCEAVSCIPVRLVGAQSGAHPETESMKPPRMQGLQWRSGRDSKPSN
jgi:integrase